MVLASQPVASVIREDGSTLESVRYIYRKQIEEADLVVVNKVDTISQEDLQVGKQGYDFTRPSWRTYVFSRNAAARIETGRTGCPRR